MVLGGLIAFMALSLGYTMLAILFGLPRLNWKTFLWTSSTFSELDAV